MLLLTLFSAVLLALVSAGGLGIRLADSRHWAWMAAQSDLLVLSAEAQWSAALDVSGSGASECLQQIGVWDCRSIIPRSPPVEATAPPGTPCQCTFGNLAPTPSLAPSLPARSGFGPSGGAPSGAPRGALAWTRVQAVLHEGTSPDSRTVLAVHGWACLVWPPSTDAVHACPELDAQTAALGIASQRAPGGTPWAVVRTWQNRWHRSSANQPPAPWEETVGQWRPGW